MVHNTPVPGFITVADAARRLGVTQQRVRQLIGNHELPAERVGRSYVVRVEDVERRVSLLPRDGRRFTPAHAWGLIEIAAGKPAPWLDRATRYRLRRLLRERGLRNLRPRLTDRATLTQMRAHPSELPGLRSDARLVLTGASAASELRLGLLAGQVVDGYLDARHVDDVVARYHLRASRDPNVNLRVVPSFSDAWSHERCAPLSAVALDLLDDPDPRTRALGEQLLEQMDR